MNLAFAENALKVLEARYLRRDGTGQIVETPEELFRRVARAVAQAESHFGGNDAAARWEERFFESLASLEFLPNSPTLMNAGTPLGLTPRGASGLAQLSGEPGSSVPRPCLTNRALP